MTVESLRVLISLSGMNQRQLATACHMTESQVSEYLSGEVAIGPVAIAKFSIGLKVSPEILAQAENLSLDDVRTKVIGDLEAKAKLGASSRAQEAGPSLPDDYEVHPDLDVLDSIAAAAGRIAIPIWQESVAASDFASNDPSQDQEFAWVPAPMARHLGAKLRAIKCAGRSMVKDGLTPGAVLLIRKTSDAKRCQGKIVIAAQHGGMTVKRLIGNRLEPNSDESYPTLILGDDATLQGEVVGIYRPSKK